MKAIANLDGVERVLGPQLNLRLGSSGRLLRTGAWLACDALQVSIAGSFRTGNIDAMSGSRYSHAKESKTRVQRKTRDAQKEVSHLTFIGCPCAKKGVNNVMLIIVSRRERTHAFSLSYDKHRVLQKLSRVASARRVNIGVGDAPIAQAEWDRLGVRRHSMIKSGVTIVAKNDEARIQPKQNIEKAATPCNHAKKKRCMKWLTAFFSLLLLLLFVPSLSRSRWRECPGYKRGSCRSR
jgi:hypothetical protein